MLERVLFPRASDASHTKAPHIPKPPLQTMRAPIVKSPTFYSLSLYSAYHMDSTAIKMASRATFPGIKERPRLDNGLLPTIEHAGSCNMSHPVSVASWVREDSPATPMLGEADQTQRRQNGRVYLPSSSLFAASDKNTEPFNDNHLPAPDRTMTAVYDDKLYSPNFVITTTPSPQLHPIISTGSDVFSQLNDAAKTQRLSAAHSPISTGSEGPSPFRIGSPFATQPTYDLDAAHESNFPWQVREQNQHWMRLSPMESAGDPATPRTVSPKDAVREFSESDADGVFPIFTQGYSNFKVDSLPKTIATPDPNGDYAGSISVKIHSKDPFSYRPFRTPAGVQALQHCPLIDRVTIRHDSSPRLSSSGASSVASGRNTPPSRGKPASTGAESGTYTCTYHGCTLRFQTPTLLKKHKREGHRQTLSRGTSRTQNTDMTSTFVSAQAGPHRCDRINPGTGKPCNTMFSRPYDLTRHEDAIHNMHKHKLRCNLCMEKKSFSRGDALTRHYRVCHPNTELPSKTR